MIIYSLLKISFDTFTTYKILKFKYIFLTVLRLRWLYYLLCAIVLQFVNSDRKLLKPNGKIKSGLSQDRREMKDLVYIWVKKNNPWLSIVLFLQKQFSKSLLKQGHCPSGTSLQLYILKDHKNV